RLRPERARPRPARSRVRRRSGAQLADRSGSHRLLFAVSRRCEGGEHLRTRIGGQAGPGHLELPAGTASERGPERRRHHRRALAPGRGARPLRPEGFLLDPEIIFLNHGSFGACPVEVLEEYRRRQDELERRPVEFLARRLEERLAEARAELARFAGAAPDDLVFVPNSTSGVNVIARSLELRPGDEVLTTDEEYGACELAWEHYGATLVRRPVEDL